MADVMLTYRHLSGDILPSVSAHDSLDNKAPVILCAGMDTVVVDGEPRLPGLGQLVSSAPAEMAKCSDWHVIAEIGGEPVYAIAVTSEELDDIAGSGEAKAPGPALKRVAWRAVVAEMTGPEQELLGRGMQFARWFAESRYCPVCATLTDHPEQEAVAQCPSCGHVQYPRLSPAMIVSVIRDGKILLARSPRFRGAFHSVLAGFVEPGESVEQCVHREVCEEAGITVDNLRYFGSQSWPMPHSLMLAFIADWTGGEITIDENEIEHADWYGPHELPNVPSELSIAGRMIRWFRETYG